MWSWFLTLTYDTESIIPKDKNLNRIKLGGIKIPKKTCYNTLSSRIRKKGKISVKIVTKESWNIWDIYSDRKIKQTLKVNYMGKKENEDCE